MKRAFAKPAPTLTQWQTSRWGEIETRIADDEFLEPAIHTVRLQSSPLG